MRIALLTVLCVGCRAEASQHASPPALGGSSPVASNSPGDMGQGAGGQVLQSSNPFHFASLPASLTPVVAPRPWKYIVVHHSASAEGSVESIDADHRERKDAAGKPWLGIGYHFVIGNGRGMTDGLVEPTFRWREQIHGAHAGRRLHNEEGIGICLIGDFERSAPTTRQVTAARELIAWLRREYDIPSFRVLRHSDVNASQCPGRRLPWNQIVSDDFLTSKDPHP